MIKTGADVTLNPHGCVFDRLGARMAASSIFQIAYSRTGSGLNLRIDRCEWTTSKNSMA